MAQWIKTDGVVEEVFPANKHFTLPDLQRFVGGYIECLYLSDGAVMYINEDGKRDELPFNKIADEIAHKQTGIAPWDPVVGDVLIATRAETGDDEEEDDDA